MINKVTIIGLVAKIIIAMIVLMIRILTVIKRVGRVRQKHR